MILHTGPDSEMILKRVTFSNKYQYISLYKYTQHIIEGGLDISIPFKKIE